MKELTQSMLLLPSGSYLLLTWKAQWNPMQFSRGWSRLSEFTLPSVLSITNEFVHFCTWWSIHFKAALKCRLLGLHFLNPALVGLKKLLNAPHVKNPDSVPESEFKSGSKKHVIYLNLVAFAFHFPEMLMLTAKYIIEVLCSLSYEFGRLEKPKPMIRFLSRGT